MRRKMIFSALLLGCLLALHGCGGGGGSGKDAAGGNGGTSGDGGGSGNTASVAMTDSYSTASGKALSIEAPGVLGNDKIYGTAEVVDSTQAGHGSVALNPDGSFTYQPDAGYSGADYFNYTIRDSKGKESTAKVNLTVTDDSPAPTKDIAASLNLSAIHVAKYKDNKCAAASYTFDDALSSQFTIAKYFEDVGLRASFFLIPNLIPEESWQYWAQLADKGHELGNHSFRHKDFLYGNLSDEEVLKEIVDAQDMIEDRTGFFPLTFVFPSGHFDDRAKTIVYKSHIATRLPGFDTDYREIPVGGDSMKTTEELNIALASAVDLGTWVVFAGHGIDIDGTNAPGTGWNPLTPEDLQAHLSFASGQASSIWIDTFVNVAQYRLCREGAELLTEIVTPNLVIVKFGKYSSSLCTKPMTVALPIIKWPGEGITARTAGGEEVSATKSGTTLLLNVVPGEEVKLSIAE